MIPWLVSAPSNGGCSKLLWVKLIERRNHGDLGGRWINKPEDPIAGHFRLIECHLKNHSAIRRDLGAGGNLLVGDTADAVHDVRAAPADERIAGGKALGAAVVPAVARAR